MKAFFWRILLEMKAPDEMSAGGIALPSDVTEAELHMSPVGRVVSIGPHAFTAKLESGIDYATHKADVKEGDWVIVNRKVGVPVKMRDGKYYQFVNDYEILTVLTEEEAKAVRAYV